MYLESAGPIATRLGWKPWHLILLRERESLRPKREVQWPAWYTDRAPAEQGRKADLRAERTKGIDENKANKKAEPPIELQWIRADPAGIWANRLEAISPIECRQQPIQRAGNLHPATIRAGT